MQIKDWKISTKLTVAFIAITLIILIVGLFNYQGMNTMQNKTQDILKASPWVDAAMEMKLSVATDMQYVMELQAAQNTAELNSVWAEHEANVAIFDVFADAILLGAHTDEGVIEAATDTSLREIVERADSEHNTKFQPAIRSVYTLTNDFFIRRDQADKAMLAMEAAYDQIIELTENFESDVKAYINKQISLGNDAKLILQRENLWADLSMEIKTTIGISRIKIEEYAQTLDPETMAKIQAEYMLTVKEFDTWIDALINGANTSEGRISKINDQQLIEKVKELDASHNEQFQRAVTELMTARNALVTINQQRAQSDANADAIGSAMQDIIGGVEENAKGAMRRARIASDDAVIATLSKTGSTVAVGALVAITLGLLITRAITRPLSEAVYVANKVAEGDLSLTIKATSKDETGQLLQAMSAMVDKLTEIIYQVRTGADSMASASEQVSATAQSMSQSATEQAASVEETTASVEHLNHSVQNNAENARVTDGIAVKASGEAQRGGDAVLRTVQAMKEIANKITLIEDIAYKTNLLSLNAAIEAAHAGEHGKGFTVVSAEVRKLAENSRLTAQEINELASASVAIAEEAGKLLEQIVPSISKTADLVQEITAASEEQSSGVNQIHQAMNQLETATQQNASASEQLAATSEELSGQAESFLNAVSFFKLRPQS